jgi:nicotinamidase-related amidase
MNTLNLRVRYFQDSTPDEIPCREENFIRREFVMPLSIAQTAFVLVDMWNVHHIDSWIERAKKVTEEAVLPALSAARAVGLTIVHAPCPEVAQQYPQLKRHASPPRQTEPDWPPAEFRNRTGPYTVYAGPRDQPPGVWPRWNRVVPQWGMNPAVEVRDDDCVIATGQQLHDFLRERGILHLIYVGFAANWCILGRDYGIRAMVNRGYNSILLRDATTGVEFPDTLAALFATEIAVREAEQAWGFTASNADFFAACRAALR